MPPIGVADIRYGQSPYALAWTQMNDRLATQRDALSSANYQNYLQRNARLGGNAPLQPGVGFAGNGGGNGGGNGNGINPLTAAMYGFWSQAPSAGASMWDASQNALASIFNNSADAEVKQALGQQALNNQAQLYKNNLTLGQGALSNQLGLGMAGYQNNLDRINATFKGLNPLAGTVMSGLGNAFGGIGGAIGNALGGGGGGGGLLGFQSSNGVSASLPTSGGMGTYNTGITQAPAMAPSQQQANINSLANAQTTAAPQTPNAQTTPAARQTMANMMAARSAAGGRSAATNLDRYQQAAEAKLGYDQQATNSQTANAQQQLLTGMYGGNLYRDQAYRQALQQGTLGRLGAINNLYSGLLGGAGSIIGGLA